MSEMPTATERATTRTPGPWTLNDRRAWATQVLGACFPDSLNRPTVCIMSGWSEGDASLVAAAPELLEAAKLAYLRLPTTAGNADALDALARAIAKAAGAL